jgi:hypothetical protein
MSSTDAVSATSAPAVKGWFALAIVEAPCYRIDLDHTRVVAILWLPIEPASALLHDDFSGHEVGYACNKCRRCGAARRP